MKKILITIMAVLVVTGSAVCADKKIVVLESDFTSGWVIRNLEPDWHVSDAGINKSFYYQTGVSTANPTDWKSEFEQKLDFSVGITPFKGFYAETAYEFLGNYADRYWQSINDSHRMEMNSLKSKWTRGLARYQSRWFKAEIFRGMGHPGWEYEGEMFGFLPEQYEVERYRRITGRVLPRGGKLGIDLPLGKFEVLAGDELIWGFGPSVFAKYEFRTGRFNNTLFYKREEIPYGDPGEDLDAGEFVTRFKLHRKLGVSAGLMYQPFRVNEVYTSVDKVAAGAGVQGTKYTFSTNKTKNSDAFGEAIDLSYRPGFLLDEITAGFTHCGILAGNKNEYRAGVNKRMSDFYGAVQYISREPVEGPLPLVYEGSPDNTGNIISSPRGRAAAFRVDRDNRKADIVNLVFNYDPTPNTWFYRWKPDVVEDWNINPGEDAGFATGIMVSFENYPESTDRNYYYDSSGNVVFEPSFMTGLSPTKRFLPNINTYSVFNLKPHRLSLEFGGGEALATTSISGDFNPVTNYMKCALGYEIGNLRTAFTYARDYWGPEDYHRDFGLIIDRLFKYGIIYTIIDGTKVHAEYIQARRQDDVAGINDLGSINEFRLGFTMHFGAKLLFEEHRVVTRKARDVKRKSKLEVGVTLVKKEFSPDGDKKDDTIDISLDVFTGMVYDWKIIILDETGRPVTNIHGRGMPPYVVVWDGIDMEYKQTLGEGIFKVYFQVTDNYNRSVMADPVDIQIKYGDSF